MRELVTILLLAVHLLALNLACCGPLFCVWLGRCGKRLPGDTGERHTDLGRRLAGWSLVAFAIGMLLGGLLLVVVPGYGLWNSLARFPVSAFWFAGAELVFSLVCLAVFYGSWNLLARWPVANGLVALLSVTNLLYHFPSLMAVIGQLAANANWTSEALLDRPHLLKIMASGEVLGLSLHFSMSSVAVSAVALLYGIARQTRDDLAGESFKHITRTAAILAALATLLQIPIGIWLLAESNARVRYSLMGGGMLASLAFMAGLTATILMLQRLVAVAIGESERRHLQQIAWLMLAVVVLMTTSLRLSRQGSSFGPAKLTASCAVPEAVRLGDGR